MKLRTYKLISTGTNLNQKEHKWKINYTKKNEWFRRKPLVDWEVGFGMRKSELRTPRRRPGCCGRVAPMFGDGSLWVILEIRRFIVFGDFLYEELKNFGCKSEWEQGGAIGIWAPKCHVTGRMHYPFLSMYTQFVGSVRLLYKFVIRFFLWKEILQPNRF